ncbi:MAG: phage tail tape measure protein [Rhodobacteraceae bacterium]|nr:phage tail tape measure protein [Paracoccaceae bacterium]
MGREAIGYDLEVKDKGASAATNKVAQRTQALVAKVKELTKATRKQDAVNVRLYGSLQKLQGRYNALEKATAKSIRSMVKQGRQLDRLKARYKGLERRLDALRAKSDKAAAAQRKMRSAMGMAAQGAGLLGGRLGSIIALVGRFGPAVLVAVVAVWALYKAVSALAKGFMAVAKAGAAYEKTILEITTISERSEFSVKKIVQITGELAAKYGVGLKAGAKALYQTISSGATTAAQATRVLTAATHLSIGGLADLPTSVDALTTSTQAYRLSNLTATQAADAMFTTVRYGKTTMQELAGQLGNVIPFASAANVSFAELNASIATLTLNGIKTQKATIQLRQAYALMIKPTKQAKDEAERLGIAFDSLAVREKGFLGVLQSIQSSAKFTSLSFGRLFGNVRALNGVNAIMIDRGYQLEDQLAHQADSLGASSDATDIMRTSTSHLVDRMISLKDAILSTMGLGIAESPKLKEALLGVVDSLSDILLTVQTDEFQDSLSRWSDAASDLVGWLQKAVDLAGKLAGPSKVAVTDAPVNVLGGFSGMSGWGGLSPGGGAGFGMGMGGDPFGMNLGMGLRAFSGETQEMKDLADQFKEWNLTLNTIPDHLLPPKSLVQSLPPGSNRLTTEEIKLKRIEADKAARLQEQDEAEKAAANAHRRYWAPIIAMRLRGRLALLRTSRDEKRATEQLRRSAEVRAATKNPDLAAKRDFLAGRTVDKEGLTEEKSDAGLRMGAAMDTLLGSKTKKQAAEALADLNEYRDAYQHAVSQINQVDADRNRVLESLQRQIAKNAAEHLKFLKALDSYKTKVSEVLEKEAERAILKKQHGAVQKAIDSGDIEAKRKMVSQLTTIIAKHREIRDSAVATLTAMQATAGGISTGDELEAMKARLQELVDIIQKANRSISASERDKASVIQSTTKNVARSYSDQARAAAQTAKAVIGFMGATAQDLIENGAKAADVGKNLAKRTVALIGQILTAQIAAAATEKTLAVGKITANAAVAGSGVAAGAALTMGPAALVIAPVMIAAMVGIITSLIGTFHEGGTMGRGGRRVPLNLGPGEYMAIKREGEMTVPTAKIPGGNGPPNSGPGGSQALTLNLGFISDPSRASFSRTVDEDIVPAMQRSFSAGRVSLNDRRSTRRSRG